MPRRFELTGVQLQVLETELANEIRSLRPGAIGVASAFVSVYGMTWLRALTQRSSPEIRIIAGTDNYVTHPRALDLAVSYGWGLRLGRAQNGIFHPKLIVAGERFVSGRPRRGKFTYFGSANMTRRGLLLSTEFGLISREASDLTSVGNIFAQLWNSSQIATPAILRSYAQAFGVASRSRSSEALSALDVADAAVAPPTDSAGFVRRGPGVPRGGEASIETATATTTWTTLETFTGGYAFQIEFPRDAAVVLRRIANTTDGRVPVLCDDGNIHDLHFKYYDHNGMYRINVPMTLPSVARIRQLHRGLAIVSQEPSGQLVLRLVEPGRETSEITAKSYSLGTWRTTSTRTYGWY